MSGNSPGGKVVIVGLGVIVPDHVTLQAQRALSACTKIFSIVQEPTLLWLPAAAHANISVVNLLRLYKENVPRGDNYETAAQMILRACSSGASIGYATYGNPMCYDSVSQELVQHAPGLGIKLEVIPGISSLDTILCDLRVDMAPAFQIYEASWMLVSEIRPVLTAAVLLLQMGTFGSFRTHYSERRDGSSLAQLVAYLTMFYPPSHKVTLVRSTGDISMPARTREFSIQDLILSTSEDLSGASLVIPALYAPQTRVDLAARMLAV
ncbi:SAM-dependent methyltransferase [Tunturiibacter gelidoferens]|uniref:SAM-dependent methyltransferase n=1 Tax=Tunturiibacter gelidiferens TaxID=3069689 RepID=A0AAU7YWF5_9BACT